MQLLFQGPANTETVSLNAKLIIPHFSQSFPSHFANSAGRDKRARESFPFLIGKLHYGSRNKVIGCVCCLRHRAPLENKGFGLRRINAYHKGNCKNLFPYLRFICFQFLSTNATAGFILTDYRPLTNEILSNIMWRNIRIVGHVKK